MKKAVATFMFLIYAIVSHAQKLPNKQEVSLRAPANIKIDGKADEWDNQYQAYNRANCTYYTVSNDDKNLYLIVHTSEWINLDKLIYGGLVFTISNPGNKKDKISIGYPLTDVQRNQLVSRPAQQYYTSLKNNIEANKNTIYALINSVNAKAAATFKEIQVSGIKEISERTISIYNTNGIKAMLLFDNKLALTYEMAVPLKYLSLSAGNTLKYNVMLIGQVRPNAGPNSLAPPSPDRGVGHYFDSPTDFGGTYILAKNN